MRALVGVVGVVAALGLAACGPGEDDAVVTAATAPPTGDQSSAVIMVASAFNTALADGDAVVACAQLTDKAQAAFVADLAKVASAELTGCADAVAYVHAQESAADVAAQKTTTFAKATVTGSTATIADSDVITKGTAASVDDDNPAPVTLVYVDGVWKIDDLG